jgi:hypothetical protein
MTTSACAQSFAMENFEENFLMEGISVWRKTFGFGECVNS